MDGKHCNPYFFRSSWNNDATPEAMGMLFQKELSDVYLLSANYQAGKDMLKGFLRHYKGKVAGRTLYNLVIPIGLPNFPKLERPRRKQYLPLRPVGWVFP